MKHVVMVACLLLTCLLPVNAQRQTSYMIYGEGLTSCGKWLATPPPDDAAMHQWVLGYSAYIVRSSWALSTKSAVATSGGTCRTTASSDRIPPNYATSRRCEIPPTALAGHPPCCGGDSGVVDDHS